jgi:TRAP-type uncharacterized transport system substrate-binding protein
MSRQAARSLIASASFLMIFTQWSPVDAQTTGAVPPVSDAQYGDLVNENTLGIVGGAPSGTFTRIIDDMASVIDDGEKLRILPIVGKGGGQNLLDLLYLKGVDLALVHANSLSAYKDEPHFRNLDKRVCYVAMLYVDELHVLSDKVTSVEQLKGKTVAYHDAASQQAGERLFRALGIKPKEGLLLNMFDAAQKMKTGDVQAIIRITAKPMEGSDQLLAINSKLRLVKVPHSKALSEDFVPAKLDKSDYDALIGGGNIDTVGVGVVLGTFNWATGSERYKRVAKLVGAFFSKAPQIVGSRTSHPKWRDLDLQAQLPGWQRCPAAQEALEAMQNIRQTVDETTVRKRIKQVAPNDPAEQEKLFKQFIEWLRTQKPEVGTVR